MLVRLSLAALAAALLATVPLAAKEKHRAEPVACSGVFGPGSSEAMLEDTFGAANVETGIVPGPEGSEMLATTVFAADPTRRLQFGWYDEDALAYPSFVKLSPGQAAPSGARIGMRPADIEKLNGAPFAIGGFWWDYGGYANIEEGAFAGKLEGGCYLSIRFAPADDLPESVDVTPVSGEVQVPSGDPLLDRIGTRVQELTLAYPWPDDLPRPEY